MTITVNIPIRIEQVSTPNSSTKSLKADEKLFNDKHIPVSSEINTVSEDITPTNLPGDSN